MKRNLSFLLLLILMGTLAGCGSEVPDNEEQAGRVLLWHTWSGADEEALKRLLDDFNEVYPDVQVISIAYPPDALKDSFVEAATQGLGPDLIIGSQLWTPELVEANLIRSLDENKFNADVYMDQALNTLRFEEKLYGLPLSIQTSALFYNKKLAEEPPQTLSALLEQAVDGHQVAINSNFESAFWGIQAFGGKLLDEEGRVVLNQGGFANWLDWLVEAGNAPNIILSRDEAILNALFAQGEVTYYVGQSSELLDLQEQMGEDVVGVSPLPTGPNDSAGPFLTTEPFFFSRDSSPAQSERARQLVEFLGNVEQQRKLAQETGRVPANPQARIDRRISPAVAGFVDQSKTAIPLLLLPQMFDVIAMGEDTYLQALEGMVTPQEAAADLTAEVNEAYGMDTVEVASEISCDASGDLKIWHAWSEAEAIVLDRIGRQYSDLCPRLTITLTHFENDDLIPHYRQAVQEGSGPDLLLVSSAQATRLASADLVANLGDHIDPEFLQRYIPDVPEAMRFEDNLYGLPLTMETMALFYNRLLVESPPVDLGDLLSQISPDRQMAITYTPFSEAHWGLAAFGGRLFDVDGNLVITEGGFEEWLTWLRDADDQPGMILTRDQTTARDLFLQGQVAYFAGDQRHLPVLQDQLGENLVGVASLPSGPEGASGPILDVQGFMANPAGYNLEAAVEFAKFATGVESQAMLVQDANMAPAHANVADAAVYPAIAGFVEQAKTGEVIANRPETNTVFSLGNIIYERVIEDGTEPAAILESFDHFFKEVHGVPIVDAEGAEVAACDQAGKILLWHSLQGSDVSALEQNISGFARHCADMQVEAVYVPAEELPSQLAAASTDGTAPDLILAAHDLVPDLSEQRLIRPVTPWIGDATLIPYLPKAVAAMSHADALFGLPYSMETTALFYNQSLVDEPPEQLFELFASASLSETLAIDASFENAFWGSLVFGGEVYAPGETPGEQLFDVQQTSLVNWLGWLQSNQDREGIILDYSEENLREMFSAGNAAYLIASSEILPQLRSAAENGEGEPLVAGVAPLPGGQAGPAAPFLTVDGFLFSAGAAEEQTQMALEFAKFVTSGPQQAQLVQSASRTPANVLALTAADDPQITTLLEQARSAVLLPPRAENILLSEGGDTMIRSVLEDEASPSEAMAVFTDYLEKTPLPVIVAYAGETVLLCDEGRIEIWYTEPLFEAENSEVPVALERLINEYNDLCPNVTVDYELVPEEALVGRLQAVADDSAPDLLLAGQAQLPVLAQAELIAALDDVVDPALEEQILPSALQSVRWEEELFGLPQKVNLVSLYYNSDQVETAASTVDDLLLSALVDTPVALDSSFHGAHWGIGAFGGLQFDAQGALLPDQPALVDWLSWLQEAQDRPGMVLNDDQAYLQEQFSSGDYRYLVADDAALPSLRERLGDSVRLVLLPEGPGGEAAPLLDVESFMFPVQGDPEQGDLALQFAQFAASESIQLLLAQEFGLVPASRLAGEQVDDPALAVFATQAGPRAAVLPPALASDFSTAAVAAYKAVLQDGLDPQTAVDQLLAQLNSQ